MSIVDKEYKFKITVVGDPAVGKTTLVKKYTTGSFQKDYISTLGAQFSNYEEKIEGKQVKLFIWDIAGQETFEVMRRKFYNGSSGAIIVFSHAPEELNSYNHNEKWFNELKKYCGDIPIALFGNKVDLINENDLISNKDKVNSDFNVGKFVNEHDIIEYFKTSALTGQGVIEAFQKLVRKLYYKVSEE
ncbi:MAG: GTP-binding protein [Candidatus Lokiarchaeota archaeon]|nr:GTP-binding protein [Candidatus Lokiarchaeota archaeon]